MRDSDGETALLGVKVCTRCRRAHTGAHNYCPPCQSDYQTERYHWRRAGGNAEMFKRRMAQVKVSFTGLNCFLCTRPLRGVTAFMSEIDGEKICTYCDAVFRLLGDELDGDAFKTLIDRIITHRNSNAESSPDLPLFRPLAEKSRTRMRPRFNMETEEWEEAEWDDTRKVWLDEVPE